MSNNLNTFSSFEDEKADLKQEFRKYLRYWPWFVLTLIVALLSAYIYIRYAPRIYATYAKIKILDESEGLELPTSAFIFKRSNINLENEIEILKSYRILEEVARQQKLNTLFFEEGTIQTARIAELPFYFEQLISQDSISNPLAYSIDVEDDYFDVTNLKTETSVRIPNHDSFSVDHDFPFEIRLDSTYNYKKSVGKRFLVNFDFLSNAALRLKSKITAEVIGEQSDLLNLSMKGESKLLSERILNTLIDVFNKDGIKDRQLVSQRTLEFIDDRFIFLAEELDSIEIDRKEFKQRNNLVDLTADAQLGLELRSRSDEDLFQVESQIAIVEMLSEALESNSKGGLLPANIGLDNNNINALISEYNLAVLEVEKLTNSGGVNNPNVKLAQSNINDLRVNILRSLNTFKQQLTVSQRQFRSRNNRFVGSVSQIPEKEKLLRAIERQQKIKESLYLLLLQKREEAAINLAITEPSIKVVDYALSTTSPISPKKRVAYAVAILAALLIPFGILYIIFMLDTKIHGKDDILKISNSIPIIAEIPDIGKKEKAFFEDPNDRTVLAESFRILSSNVNYLMPITEDEDKGKVIYCTSTIKGEGKTFISINLSLALSSMNKKVLLIGADLRNPQIHTHTKYEKNTTGLSDYLHDGTYHWKDNLITGFSKHEYHHILLSGNIPPNPTSLLTNGRFEDMINEAKEIYDYVIVDTAPTVLVTDTMLISKFADVTVYIARANFTDKKVMEFPQELHQTGKLKNMAYVINGVGASKSYGYGYNYGYGYGYGYTGTNKKRT
ncbi:GumC family protein [Psychroserpens sp. XS_ASV72]|uniref:GumC family protein n=1 Tax=Psychroserpens sp. XS_ASV72 TaxID=3241293 RepID=UPI003511167A